VEENTKKKTTKKPKDPPAEFRWKPGQSGNPSGRGKMPAELQKASKLSAHKLIAAVNKYIHMTKDALNADLRRPEASMLELLVGGMIARAVKDQDPVRANFILDRTIGKVIDKMEIDVSSLPKPVFIERLDGTMVELGHKMVETIEGEVFEDNSGSR
jgi:hypothetical protein